MPAKISADDEAAANQHKALTGGNDLVPAGELVQIVAGDGAEPAALLLLKRLQASAQMLGDHTDAVRAVVKQNAVALSKAAVSLKDADDLSAAKMTQFTSIVTSTAEDTTKKDVAVSQTFLANEKSSGAEGDNAKPAAVPSTDGSKPTPTPAADGSKPAAAPAAGPQPAAPVPYPAQTSGPGL